VKGASRPEPMFPAFLSGLLGRVFRTIPTRTIIVGADARGRLLARELSIAGRAVSLIDEELAVSTGMSREVSLFRADPTDPAVLDRAGASFTELLFAATSNNDVNLRICRIARHEFKVPTLIACGDSPCPYDQDGIEVANWTHAAEKVLERLNRTPMGARILGIGNSGEKIAELEVLSPAATGYPVRRFVEGCSVMELRHGDRLMEVDETTTLEVGDVLTLIGTANAIDSVALLLRRNC